MRNLILWILLWASVCVHADIFRWTDDQGRVHYGDRPDKTHVAQPLVLKSANSYTHVSISDIFPGLLDPAEPQADRPRVVMYMAPWCSVCKRANAWMRAQGIAFTERNIDDDAAAHERWSRLGGTGVPLITVGRKKMKGFSEDSFMRLYKSQSR